MNKTARPAVAAALAAGVLAGCAPLPPMQSERSQAPYSADIRRTQAGIAHVKAADWGSLGYGYGYVQAEDNLCTLADGFVTFRGERSAWFGADARPPAGASFGQPRNLDADFFFRLLADGPAVERYRADVQVFLARAPELMQLGDVRAELLLAAKLSREFNERNDALLRVLILEQSAIPKKAQRHFQQAWEDGYRLYARWLEAKLGPKSGVDIEAAAIQLFGSLTQYQVQVETFSHPPLNVDPDRFSVAWADHWTAFITSRA